MEWTDTEYRILFRNCDLPAERLLERLPGSSIGAIRAVLGGVDQYRHGRANKGLLSKLGLAILEEEEFSFLRPKQ